MLLQEWCEHRTKACRKRQCPLGTFYVLATVDFTLSICVLPRCDFLRRLAQFVVCALVLTPHHETLYPPRMALCHGQCWAR